MRTHRIARLYRLAAVGALAVVGLAGCTSGDDETPDGGVTAPGGGDVTETVAPVEVPTLEPATLTDTVENEGVEVSVSSIEKTTVEALAPGDVAGPALVVTVSVTNGGEDPVDVGSAVVILTLGDGSAAAASSTEPAAPLEGSLKPGKSAEGVYVFSVPEEVANPVQVTVNYTAGVPVAVFTGDIS